MNDLFTFSEHSVQQKQYHQILFAHVTNIKALYSIYLLNGSLFYVVFISAPVFCCTYSEYLGLLLTDTGTVLLELIKCCQLGGLETLSPNLNAICSRASQLCGLDLCYLRGYDYYLWHLCGMENVTLQNHTVVTKLWLMVWCLFKSSNSQGLRIESIFHNH